MSSGISGHIEIDSSACRAAYGLKEQLVWVRERNQAAQQAAMDGLARMTSEGKRMASIENNENAVQAIAFDKNLEWDRKEVTWATIPLPTIKYHPSPGRFVDISI